MSTDFIHVSTDSTVTAAAVDGALDTIEVVAGGSSYSLSTGSTITAIPIRGDGSSGVCSVTISAGAIASAAVTTAGTGYTYAYIRNADIIAGTNAGGAGSGANLNVIIPPKGGHGKNALKELGAFYVMINKSLTGAEGTSDIGVNNDFRQIRQNTRQNMTRRQKRKRKRKRTQKQKQTQNRKQKHEHKQ